jgi:hypothetical protein
MPPFKTPDIDALTVKARQKARKWVKERLKMHPGKFVIKQSERSCPCWNGEIAVQLENTTDRWSGWFPVTDIEMISNWSSNENKRA